MSTNLVRTISLTYVTGSKAASIGKISTSIYMPIIDKKSLSTVLPRILHECNEKHVHCSRAWQSAYAPSARPLNKTPLYNSLQVSRLPSRVVVAMWEDHGKPGPFLLETKGVHGIYATLSHCWGSHTDLRKTTRLTLNSNLEALNLSSSSPGTKTFREAVDVCRLFGIPYLWIDCLCIIQHDPSDPNSNLDDWMWEALDMGRIYRDSALTIAATGASDDPSNGLYGNRLRLAQYVGIPFKMDEDDKLDDLFYVSLSPRAFDAEVSNSHLYTRGWVLQERLLSPRYLHFGKDQWFWQCREETFAEIAGFEDGETNIGSDLGMSQSILKDDIKFTHWWTKIAETYSRLDFTIAGDRFVALQGLVSEIKKIKPQEHYYGMWSNKFYIQLMWYVDANSQRETVETFKTGDSTTPAPPMPYTPSWSWMSSPGPVGHPRLSDAYEPSYETVEAKTRTYPELSIIRPAFEHRFKHASTPGHPGSSVPIIRAQIQGAIIVHPAQPTSTPLHKMAAEIDRSGPMAQLARGTYNIDYPTSMQAARGPLKGKDIGRCKLDRDEYRQITSCACIRISNHLQVVEGREELKSVDVLLVYPAKGVTTESLAVRRIGTGVVHDVRWFEACGMRQFIML